MRPTKPASTAPELPEAAEVEGPMDETEDKVGEGREGVAADDDGIDRADRRSL